jgi:S-adenosylmethionine:tRNA ribosyltransferase-isomerase
MRDTADYDYELPPGQIAQAPADRRDASRLLVLGDSGPSDRDFVELGQVVPEGAVLVVNDTRVLPARVRARKQSGGAVELLFVEPAGSGPANSWRCLAKASKAIRAGAVLTVEEGGPEIVVAEGRTDDGTIVVTLPEPAVEFLDRIGEMPLPPYIERPVGGSAADLERYQTMFANIPGAVAAPTAGLHFTDSVIESLTARGVDIARVTLHVGLGTFAPVRVDSLDDITLHAERYRIDEHAASLVSSGRPVVAVGTTSVRALEAAAVADHRVEPTETSTNLFISPGYRFSVVDHLVTNFHLPKSTLLMLVCAFGGYQRVLAGYRHAVEQGYRFYSYGDAMFLSREHA